MLLQFVRDVVIAVAALAALIALVLKPSHESDAAPAVEPVPHVKPPATVDTAAAEPAVKPTAR
jgi:hypothetical protein